MNEERLKERMEKLLISSAKIFSVLEEKHESESF
jgi:hypothetical protein